MTTAEHCSECARPLLINNDALRCCYRSCPAYGQPQEPTTDAAEDNGHAYNGEWLQVQEAINEVRAKQRQQHKAAA